MEGPKKAVRPFKKRLKRECRNVSIVSSMVRIVNYENKLMNGTMKSHTVSVVS